LGKKLDFSLRFGRPPFFSPSCRFIQIDADQNQLGETERVILPFCGDPSIAVRQLIMGAQTRQFQNGSWSEEIEAAQDTLPAEWEHLRRSFDQPIHPLRVCEGLQPFLEHEAILVSDGGEFGQWAQAGLAAHTRLINGLSGSIGSSLPMALGAKLAHPDHQVFVTLGDGTFGYHALEFDTALRYNLPIIAIIGNDARWNAEYQLQLQHYGPDRTIGCELLPSRYDKIVTALGGHGEFVEHPDDLTPAIKRALASGLPACINVRIKSVKAPTFGDAGSRTK
jgi:acetolactate synthase-1/2/3 large subunit